VWPVSLLKLLIILISARVILNTIEDGEVKQLILHILPKQNEKILNKAGNVQNEIITEYSVRYKSIVRYDD